MKSGRGKAARGSIPGSSPRPDREHRKPQPTTCYTVVCVKTAVEISEESRSVSRHPAALVGCLRLKPTDQPGHYWCLGWPDFLEFSLPTDSNPPAAVGLNGLSRSETWELWWASDGSGWSRDRIIVLQPSRRQETTSDWVLPLEQIPGLDLAQEARERRIVGSLKPFRWNPAGNQSRPVEPDQQPEASLAWWVGDHPCEA